MCYCPLGLRSYRPNPMYRVLAAVAVVHELVGVELSVQHMSRSSGGEVGVKLGEVVCATTVDHESNLIS